MKKTERVLGNHIRYGQGKYTIAIFPTSEENNFTVIMPGVQELPFYIPCNELNLELVCKNCHSKSAMNTNKYLVPNLHVGLQVPRTNTNSGACGKKER